VREKPHLARSRARDAGNFTLPAAFRHIRALFGPGRGSGFSAAALSGAIATEKAAARK